MEKIEWGKEEVEEDDDGVRRYKFCGEEDGDGKAITTNLIYFLFLLISLALFSLSHLNFPLVAPPLEHEGKLSFIHCTIVLATYIIN